MRYFTNKCLSILLFVAIVICTMLSGTVASTAIGDKPVVVAPAHNEIVQNNRTPGDRPNPIVVVPGIGMSDVAVFDNEGNQIQNDGTFKDQWRVLNFSMNEFNADIWKFIPKILLSLILQKDVGLSGIVRDYMPEMFKYSKHDLQGKSIENVKAIERNYPLAQYDDTARKDFLNMIPIENYLDVIGEDRIYCFNFPPFCNTYDQAARLNEFVQLVKMQTGSEKVSLVPLSLGATIVNAYFDEYASQHDVGKVISIVGAWDGSYVFSDLVSQNYSVDSAKLFYKDIMPQFMVGYQGYLVNLALRILPKKVFNNVLDAAFDVVRSDFFINTPSMWSIVPADRYKELADIYLNDAEHADIKTQTDKYFAYQSHLRENTHRLIDDGVEMYNLCGYGLNFGRGGWYEYFQFLNCADEINSDGVIQLTSTGMGTFSASPGTTLPVGYTQQNSNCGNPAHNHISPDNVVDASTAYLPDQTWYFANQHHESTYNDVLVKLACILMSTDTIKSVYSDASFPQFNGNRNTERIIKDYLPKCIQAQSRLDISAADMQELNKAVEEANAMLASTIADDMECKSVEARLNAILIKIGVNEAPEPPSKVESMLEKLFKQFSDTLWEKYGPKGYSEIVRNRLRDR